MPTWCRNPAVHGHQLFFVAEDDLWSAPLEGGQPCRLTAGLGAVTRGIPSPDGEWLALTCNLDGSAEVYVMPVHGGPLRRLTWHGETAAVRAWHPDGRIVYTTAAQRPSAKHRWLHAVSLDGTGHSVLPWGPAEGVAWGAGGRLALCRHQDDPARWKRYRGGRMGQLWVDVGGGPFQRLQLQGNVARPMWRSGRLWFVCDADGTGNLWSCDPDGEGLRQETHYSGAYVRHAHSDGETIVFVREGHVHRLGSSDKVPRRISLDDVGARPDTIARSTDAARWLEGADLHPKGHRLALTSRGRLFVMGCMDGPVRQLGERQGVRYREPRWLPNGYGLVVVTDEGGEEALEVRSADGGPVQRLDVDVGRVLALEPSPDGERVAWTNHRYEVGVVVLGDRPTTTVLDRSHHGRIDGISWSSDGRWLAWSRPDAPMGAAARIRVARVSDGAIHDVTDGSHRDTRPSFDPDGKYLYFLSARDLDPVYDNITFGLSFPHAMRPWAAVLSAEGAHPFRPAVEPPVKASGPRAPKSTPATHIDPGGLPRRIVRFPLNEAVYSDIRGLPGGWVLLTRRRAKGSLGRRWFDPGPPPADDSLIAWSMQKQEAKLVHARVTGFRVAGRGETVLLRRGDSLRVFSSDPDRAKKEALGGSGTSARRTGWIDLGRVRLTVDPRAEWRQIAREAWRLMRDHFWSSELGGIDWDAIWERYAVYVDRVATRGDLDDILWLMQGELGTSHAYAMGGDRRRGRRRQVGRLGATLSWSESDSGWRVDTVFQGDPGDRRRSSPLTEVGVDIQEGDVVMAVDGRRLDAQTPPAAALLDRAEQPTWLTVRRGEGPPRERVVYPQRDDRQAVYRHWVLRNRARVHAATSGRCGYVHIPDMGPSGFAHFHRDFKVESGHEALIVDVRANGGGHVSQLLLDKLARRRLGFKVQRHGEPAPYPAYSRAGPSVCITDAFAGSDGDIFSHAWRAMGLGPLIGTRTWGGVVGIWPRQRQVDRGLVTQPEFASWWPELGYSMENHGVEPDVVVPFPPEAHGAGEDPQLARALALIADGLAAWEEPPLPGSG